MARGGFFADRERECIRKAREVARSSYVGAGLVATYVVVVASLSASSAGAAAALEGVLGKAILPVIGAASAGSIGSVAWPLFIGGALIALPCLALQRLLTNIVIDAEKHPKMFFVLWAIFCFGTNFASAAIGASILGMAITPVALSAFAGHTAILLGLQALSAICKVITAARSYICNQMPLQIGGTDFSYAP